MLSTTLETLRLRYKPSKVRWLFIGESPPANGTFFYKADSNLSRYTQKAFSIAFEKRFTDGAEFLNFFKAQGCYLIDLCNDPINNLPNSERNYQRMHGAISLPERIAAHSPHGIIVVMKAIVKYIRPAVKQAGLEHLPFYTLLFPSMGNQHRYTNALVQVIHKENLVQSQNHP
jgi:hypothetical protein